MFYRCPKCKRVWQYPIERCPDCFVNLEKVRQKEIRVVAVSRVEIPSVSHLKTPYFVLLLEDENGNRWVQKSAKEYKIGDKIKIEPSQEEKTVAIWTIKYDMPESWKKVIELIGGIKPESETRVLLLPTLVSPSHPHLGENTSPEFLEAAIKYLLEKGAKRENIKVAGQSFNEFPIEISAQKSQLLKVCQKEKIEPLNLSEGKFLEREGLKISQKALEADLIINLPRLKIGEARASQNLFKLLDKTNYLAQEYLSTEKEIFEKLKKQLPPVLTVAQADSVQKQDGRIVHMRLTMASLNPLYLDRIFAQITASPLPKILKNVNTEDIRISGRKIEELEWVF